MILHYFSENSELHSLQGLSGIY